MPNTHPHTAKSVYLSCIDDRLVESDAEFAASVGTAFHTRLAGGGLALLNPVTQAVAMQQLAIPHILTGVTDVYLESHTACGAYQLAGVTFESDTAEIERLYADLEEAAENARTALIEAGAAEDKVVVHTRVVDPTGKLQERA